MDGLLLLLSVYPSPQLARHCRDLSVPEETKRLPGFLAGSRVWVLYFLGERCCWNMQCRAALRFQELQGDCVAPQLFLQHLGPGDGHALRPSEVASSLAILGRLSGQTGNLEV